MSDIVSWEGYAQAPKALEFKQFLYDLNLKYRTQLTILDHDKGFFRETIRFVFKGQRHLVAALSREFQEIVQEYEKEDEKLSFYTQSRKAQQIKVTYNTNNVHIEIIASKNEPIHTIAVDIKKHFGIDYKLSQTDNGFLRGKTVNIEVFASHEQRKLFVEMMEENLKCKQPTIVHDNRASKAVNSYHGKVSYNNNYHVDRQQSLKDKVASFSTTKITVDKLTVITSPNGFCAYITGENSREIYSVLDRIKNHFGIDYTAKQEDKFFTIYAEGSTPEMKVFTDTVLKYMNSRVEPMVMTASNIKR